MATHTTSTQPKPFPENVSAGVKESLVGLDLHEEADNEDATAHDALLPSTTGNRDSGIHSNTVTRSTGEDSDHDQDPPLRNGGNGGKMLHLIQCVAVFVAITLFILLCICYITLEITHLHDTQQSSIISHAKNSIDNFTCTGVYTLLAMLTKNLKSISRVEVRGIPNKGDTADIFLTECINVNYGSTTHQADCRASCGIQQDKLNDTITTLTASNNTQECILCIPGINRNTHDAHCNRLCQLDVTSELIYSANGSGLCIIGKGVSSGDGTCQKTFN